MNEKISIVMLSYNYADYIGAAIKSVINQTYSNWELIIIDDASTDNSVEIINEYLKDPRIRLYINKNNIGLAKSLKRGINLTTGQWIAFLESDDCFYPTAIEEKVKAISTGADLIFTDYTAIPNPHCTDEYLKNRQKYTDLNESKFVNNFNDIIYFFNIIPTFSVVMIRKDGLNKLNYNSPVKVFLDWFLWMQSAALNIKVYYISKKLTYWRRHDKSYMVKYSNSWYKEFIFEFYAYKYKNKNKNILVKIFKFIKFLRVRLIMFYKENDYLKIKIFRKYVYSFKFK